MPTGRLPAAMPQTISEIGSVARLLSGAIIEPRMPPVTTITVLLAPASAWPIASTSALRLARRSPAAASKGASAIADMNFLPEHAPQKWAPVLQKRACVDKEPEQQNEEKSCCSGGFS